MFRPASLVTVALLLATPAFPQDKTGDIDKIFSWATPATPGCTVAASNRGKVVVNRAYGLADLERDVPLNPHSTFDIGSVQKQFTAAATLLLVEEGRLSLSDDVHKHVPELPDYGHKITLDHLLTHTSGVRDWDGMLPLASANPDALTLILRQRSLDFAPGDEWSYSNSGYVLLKEIVARTSGMSFADFTRKRLFEPLGMKASSYRLDLREIVRHRALAYDRKGESWRLDMQLDNDRGGGGALLSTAGDLLIWNDALTSGRLGAFVTGKLHEPARLNNGRKLNYARGLRVEPFRGDTLVSHSGGAAGYSSWLGRIPAHGLSIAVLCNSGDPSASALARSVGEQFLPAGRSEPAGGMTDATKPSTAVTELELNAKAGLFVSEATGELMHLVVDKGTLRLADGPRLVAVTKDRFRNPRGMIAFMSQDEFELHFVSPNEFRVKSMEGKTTGYRRAEPYAPTPADLQALAGRYESDELGTVFRTTAGKGGLLITLEHSPDRSIPFRPIHRDTFQAARMTVRFHRDKAGKVISLNYSNPVVRHIKFTRLGDRLNTRESPRP